MTENKEVIEAEAIPQQQALVVRQEHHVATGLFGAVEPAEVINKAAQVASALKDVVVKQGLVSNIQGKQYPRCEAWTLLGTMLGVFPVLVWTKPKDGGWEARVEARTKDGAIVGAAEAECLKSEKNWKDRDDFAIRSMAQTRATAKCLRMPLGFIMTMAGYEPTPAEEMVSNQAPNHPAKPPSRTAKASEPPKPSPATPQEPKHATEATRKWFVGKVKESREQATQFAIDLGWIMPNEKLEDMPLRFVPNSKPKLVEFMAKMLLWSASGKVVPPYEPDWDAEPGGNKEVKKGQKPEPTEPPGGWQGAADHSEDDAKSEPWYNVIVPIPHKGEKRDAYLKNPDTIGSLYELRHDDEDARKRLWGFVSHYEPKGWTGKDGKERPPSKSDIQFREALDQFKEFFDKAHPEERL